jgi:hypothetical protein
VVGPRVAERLGAEFLDREIPEDVARRTDLSEEAVGGVDEKPSSRVERLAETLGRASNITGDSAGSSERPDVQEHQLRGYIEDSMARLSASGGVLIGRVGPSAADLGPRGRPVFSRIVAGLVGVTHAILARS